MRYLLTQDSITVVIQERPYSISSRADGFVAVRDAVLAGKDPIAVLGLIQAKAKLVQQTVKAALGRQQLTGRLEYLEGLIYYDGKPLYNYAVESLVKFLELGHDVGALAAFIDKQQQNPDPEVHSDLYKFLEFGKIPLTEDGDFLVYKAVRGDHKDINSGTFDNSVGQKPRMAGGRGAVNPDRNQTCSYGLHVCSFGYLPHFAHAQGHVMICKVDPRDVVAIPVDYNNTKMRVIGYEVVGEVTSYYSRGEDILSQERLAAERWKVEYQEGRADAGLKEVYDFFYTKDEAIHQADSLIGRDDVIAAQVIDTKDGSVVHDAS